MPIGLHPIMNDGAVGLPSMPRTPYSSSGPSWVTFNPTVPLPPSLQGSGSVSRPSPVYSGSHINNVHQVASALGASSNYDPESGMVFVNQRGIKPTSMVNGEPHAPVRQVAQAAGYPSTHIQSTNTGVQIMPRQTSAEPLLIENSPNHAAVQQLQRMLGIEADGFFGPETLQAVRNFQIQHNLQLDGKVGPQTWTALNAFHGNAAPAQQPQPQQTAVRQAQMAPAPAPQQPDIVTQLMQLATQGAPQAPTPVQLPTFDASQMQPFQFDRAQAIANAMNDLNPSFEQQMSTGDRNMEESQNARGIFNSGVGQQMENQFNEQLANQETQAAMKQADSQRTEAFKEYQGNIDNQFKVYTQALNAAKAQGQLNEQQYKDQLSSWQTQVNMAKALLPYEAMTKYQQADLQFRQQQEQFNEWDKIQQLKQGQEKIAQAAQNAALNARLRQEGINLQSAQFSEKQKVDAINATIKAAGLQNNQLRLRYDATNSQLSAVTKQIDSFRASNPGQPVPPQLDSEASALISQLSDIAAQVSGGNADSSTTAFTPAHGFRYAN